MSDRPIAPGRGAAARGDGPGRAGLVACLRLVLAGGGDRGFHRGQQFGVEGAGQETAGNQRRDVCTMTKGTMTSFLIAGFTPTSQEPWQSAPRMRSTDLELKQKSRKNL